MNKPLYLVSAMAAFVGVPAVETDLLIGPHEVVASLELLSQHIHRGREYSNEPTARAAVAGRLYNLGVKVTGNVVLTDSEDDRQTGSTFGELGLSPTFPFVYSTAGDSGVTGGEMTEVNLRVDYLFDLADYTDPLGEWFSFQLIPHYQGDYNPYQGLMNVHEPHWIGADGWFNLPPKGLEIGGNYDYDASGNHGWHSGGGLRQIMKYAPIDMRFWQVINVGDPDFIEYLVGIDDRRPAAEEQLRQLMIDMSRLGMFPGAGAMPGIWRALIVDQALAAPGRTEEFAGGITTVEAGAEVMLPNIWQDTFVSILLEGHWWVNHRARNHVRDAFEMVIGAGIEYRFRSVYNFIRY